jgi:peroxiredoxin
MLDMMEERQVGLDIGAPAPAFRLRSVSGGYRSLTDWRGRRILLVFIQPHCRGSRALLPVIAGLLPEPQGGQPVPVVVTFGPQPAIRQLVEAFGLRCAVLSEDDPDVINSYRVHGTPACYLIDERGCIVRRGGTAKVLAAAGLMAEHDRSNPVTAYRSARDWLRRLTADRRARGEDQEVQGSSLLSAGHELKRNGLPLVSVILTTRERPQFLPLALECYRRQTYPRRELIVVDDGSQYPADEGAVKAAGGRLVRMPDRTPLGDKLNRGVQEAYGQLFHKWDDDDWYAPDFLHVMVSAYLQRRDQIGRSPVAYQIRSLWFDLAEWRILDWSNPDPSGGTLLCAREGWERWPFRQSGDDMWFVADQLAVGVSTVPVYAPELYLYVRHDSCAGGPDHLWLRWDDGKNTLAHLRELSVHRADPSSFLPEWAASAYRELSGRVAETPQE